ncbi:MAG: alpha/beta hydrolase, partial [Bacteroidetes bacterium]|nr:alpha/beta hydrolase [Bacteroidota bacterium]
YDSLADALLKNGDNKGSKENYEKALSMVKDDANKKRITKTLKSF